MTTRFLGSIITLDFSAGLAQLVEQRTCNAWVESSSPSASTKFQKATSGGFLFTILLDMSNHNKQNTRTLGGVPERSKGADCKSAASASVVRIHSPPPFCGYGIVAITSAFQADEAGSTPATRSKFSRYSSAGRALPW